MNTPVACFDSFWHDIFWAFANKIYIGATQSYYPKTIYSFTMLLAYILFRMFTGFKIDTIFFLRPSARLSAIKEKEVLPLC